MSREREHAHPVFAQVYRLVAAAGERGGFGQLRASVLADASGRLAHLPAAVTSVVAVEPDPSMRALARGRVTACPVPVTLLSADAHALPLADGSVDAVLCACVLCSVAQPPRALAELRRVLVPGGRLLLLEHVAAPPGHWVGRLQQLLQPVWGRAAGGCSVRRDTWGAVAAAGFDVTAVRTAMVWPNLPPVAPTVLGTAVSR
jgi:SAM-dependent methyltransferase